MSKASETITTKCSKASDRKLADMRKRYGVPKIRLLDMAIEEAERNWRAKGIHIPPATAGRG